MAAHATDYRAAMPPRISESSDDGMDAAPPPITRRHHPPRQKTANSVRSRPADPQLLSSMIDSLGDVPVPTSSDRRKYYERVEGYQSTPPRQRIPSDAILVDESAAAPAPAIGRQRSSDRFSTISSRPASHYGDHVTASPPVSIRSKRNSMQSLDVPENAFRRLFRTGSMRSRSSLTVPSMHSNMSSDTITSTRPTSSILQTPNSPTPRPTSPTTSLSRQITSQSRLVKSLESVDETRAAAELAPELETPRKDSHAELGAPKSVPLQPVLSASIPRKPLPDSARTQQTEPEYLTTPSHEGINADASFARASPSQQRKRPKSKKTKSTSSSTRSSPMPSPALDDIPLRGSSLNHEEKRQLKAEKKALRKSKGVRSSKSKSKLAQPSNILDELGEDDGTVKRIRELQQQKEARLQHEKIMAEAEAQKQATVHKSQHAGPRPQLNAARSSGTSARPSATQEPLAAPVPNANPKSSRLADNAKAHRMLGLSAAQQDMLSRVSRQARIGAALAKSPEDPPTSARPLHLHSHSVDSTRSTSPPRLDFDYAYAVRSLESPSIASTDRSQTDNDEMIGVRKQPGLPSGFVDARTQALMIDTSFESQARRASIDDEVESFLANPRLNQTVRHPKTKRIISFSEVGDPNGFAVFVCIGMGLTRFVTAFYDELATTLGLRLITPERPGVGKSERYTDRDATGPMSWHQDVHAICQVLQITDFSLLAHSAGAIYALATALVIPQHVRGKIYLLAPWIPPSQLETTTTTTPITNSLPYTQRLLRVLPVSFLRAANSSFLGLNTHNLSSPTTTTKPPLARTTSTKNRQSNDLSHLLTSTTAPTDLTGTPTTLLPTSTLSPTSPSSPTLSATAFPTDPSVAYFSSHLSAAQHALSQREAAYSSALLHRIWAAATADSNPADDLLVCLERTAPVGFRYVDVRREAVIYHGDADRRVRLERVRGLVGGMNAAREERRRRGREEAIRGLEGGGAEGRDGMGKGEVGEGGCELRVLKGQGHGLLAVASVMGEVLGEIAGGWRRERGRR